jgi:hypothetical protein
VPIEDVVTVFPCNNRKQLLNEMVFEPQDRRDEIYHGKVAGLQVSGPAGYRNSCIDIVYARAGG